MTVLALAGICLVLVLAFKYVQQIRFVRQFPHPHFPLPFLGNAAYFLGKKPEDILPIMNQMVEEAGATRIASGMLGWNKIIGVMHPELLETVLSSTVHITKSKEYDVLLPWLRTGLLMSTGQKWHQRRKLLTPAFHFKILEDAMDVFNKNADTLTHILLEDSENGDKVIDLFPYVTRCTLDIILEAAMGKTLDIQHNKHSQYAQCVNSMLHLAQQRQFKPWLWFGFIFQFSEMKREQDKCLAVLHGFTKAVIKEKRDEQAAQANAKVANGSPPRRKGLAFLDILFTVKTADGQPLSDTDLQEEVDTFMFEGHDTTACAISWALLLLANHREVQDKIVQEQWTVFGNDPEADVDKEHLTKMPYLEACVKEALRLYPSVPIIGRRVSEDFYMDGKLIPTGTTILISPMQLHRNRDTWKDPEAFIPERFIPGTKDFCEHHPFAYIPFSAGARNCIGQRFALMEEKTVLSKLLRKVEVIKADAVDDVPPSIEIITRPRHGIRAYFRPRTIS